MHGFPKCEGGEEIKEELAIYHQAVSYENNVYKWKFDSLPDAEFLEDQLMEEFTFKVGKRLLGVEIGTGEDDELMFHTVFRKYKREDNPTPTPQKEVDISSEDIQETPINNFHSKIISRNESSIVMEEFASIKWQSQMFEKAMKILPKAKPSRVFMTFGFVTIVILGVASIVAFLLKMFGVEMGTIYWSTVFVFLFFIYFRLYKMLLGKESSGHYSRGILESAKKKNFDIDNAGRRIIRFEKEFIQWENKEGALTDLFYKDTKAGLMNYEGIVLVKNDNIHHTIKLVGLSKEEMYHIKRWMHDKSNDNQAFEWIDET